MLARCLLATLVTCTAPALAAAQPAASGLEVCRALVQGGVFDEADLLTEEGMRLQTQRALCRSTRFSSSAEDSVGGSITVPLKGVLVGAGFTRDQSDTTLSTEDFCEDQRANWGRSNRVHHVTRQASAILVEGFNQCLRVLHEQQDFGLKMFIQTRLNPGEFDLRFAFVDDPSQDDGYTIAGLDLPTGVKCSQPPPGKQTDDLALTCANTRRDDFGRLTARFADHVALSVDVPPIPTRGYYRNLIAGLSSQHNALRQQRFLDVTTREDIDTESGNIGVGGMDCKGVGEGYRVVAGGCGSVPAGWDEKDDTGMRPQENQFYCSLRTDLSMPAATLVGLVVCARPEPAIDVSGLPGGDDDAFPTLAERVAYRATADRLRESMFKLETQGLSRFAVARSEPDSNADRCGGKEATCPAGLRVIKNKPGVCSAVGPTTSAQTWFNETCPATNQPAQPAWKVTDDSFGCYMVNRAFPQNTNMMITTLAGCAGP